MSSEIQKSFFIRIKVNRVRVLNKRVFIPEYLMRFIVLSNYLFKLVIVISFFKPPESFLIKVEKLVLEMDR